MMPGKNSLADVSLPVERFGSVVLYHWVPNYARCNRPGTWQDFFTLRPD